MKQSIESSKPYTPAYSEDTYDEINAELLELAARSMEDDTANADESSRILIGSGEDCLFVLFSTNYKPSYVQ